MANAAVVKAGSAGDLNVYVTHRTHLIIDINGYFTSDSDVEGLSFYTVDPCRVVETRFGSAGPLGPPSLAANSMRAFPLLDGSCGIPGWAT